MIFRYNEKTQTKNLRQTVIVKFFICSAVQHVPNSNSSLCDHRWSPQERSLRYSRICSARNFRAGQPEPTICLLDAIVSGSVIDFSGEIRCLSLQGGVEKLDLFQTKSTRSKPQYSRHTCSLVFETCRFPDFQIWQPGQKSLQKYLVTAIVQDISGGPHPLDKFRRKPLILATESSQKRACCSNPQKR
jgi:hypothetical protein